MLLSKSTCFPQWFCGCSMRLLRMKKKQRYRCFSVGLALGLVEYWRFHAQHFVQFRRGGGVLHVDLLVREDIWCSAEGSQSRFVEARQNQLLLARIGVDVAHGEDARNI